MFCSNFSPTEPRSTSLSLPPHYDAIQAQFHPNNQPPPRRRYTPFAPHSVPIAPPPETMDPGRLESRLNEFYMLMPKEKPALETATAAIKSSGRVFTD